MLRRLNVMTVSLGVASLCLAGSALAEIGELRASGPIDAIASDSVTVGGVAYGVTALTKIENNLDQRITLAELAVGTVVKVEYIDVSGVHQAKEIEIEGQDGHGSHNGSHSGSGFQKKKAKAKLAPQNGATAKGKIEAKTEKKSSKFEVSVKIKKNGTPAIADAAQAGALSVAASIVRGGSAIAQCVLALKSSNEENHSQDYFEYRAKIELKTKKDKTPGAAPGTMVEKLTVKAGSCDIDLATQGDQPGIPAIQKDDVIEVSAGGGVILSGTAK